MGERILMVEDNAAVSNMIGDFFRGRGYQVDVVTQGNDALEWCGQHLPDLILLDTTLPDVDGFTVCRQLRQATRTSLIPIVILTEQADLQSRVAGLEAGADDYVTKPFDIEELNLRVKAAIRSHQHFSLTDAQTGMPSGRLIEEQLRNLLRTRDWTLLYIGVDHLAPFHTEYGFVTGDEVLRFAGNLIQEVVTAMGTLDDFVGRASNEVFIVITKAKDTSAMIQQLRDQFNKGVQLYYKPEHRERGGILQSDGTLAPLMCFSIGAVTDKTDQFYDIVEITRAAAGKRRADQRGQA